MNLDKETKWRTFNSLIISCSIHSVIISFFMLPEAVWWDQQKHSATRSITFSHVPAVCTSHIIKQVLQRNWICNFSPSPAMAIPPNLFCFLFFFSYRKKKTKKTCLVGLGTTFLNDLENGGLYLIIDSKASLSIWVCFTQCNLYLFSASQTLQKWVELPRVTWNGSVTLTLTWVLRLNNNLLSWKFNVCRSFLVSFAISL